MRRPPTSGGRAKTNGIGFPTKLEVMTRFQTPAELGEEAMKALRESRESPHEHFERLVRLGWINRQGEVTRLLGGDVEPEPDSEPAQAARAKKKLPKRS